MDYLRLLCLYYWLLVLGCPMASKSNHNVHSVPRSLRVSRFQRLAKKLLSLALLMAANLRELTSPSNLRSHRAFPFADCVPTIPGGSCTGPHQR